MALTSVSELQTLIHEHITRTPRLPEIEYIPVAQSIGRVLAEDMVSALNIPATDMSAMDAKEFVHQTVNEHPVVLFMKGTAQFPQCGFSGKAIQILKNAGIRQLVTINILEDEEVRQAVKDYSNWPTIPQLYINGEFIGGTDIMAEMAESGELQKLIPEGNKAA